MNAKQKLLAAAEKIEQQIAKAPTPLPWAEDRGDVAHFYPEHQEYGAICSPADGEDTALIVTAANAMPALAAWLRWEAECAGVPEHSHKALAVADQILGGAR